MNLSDRIRLIISENNLKQKEFAKSINVTESYISKLLRGESGLSNSTATLIEERYGYTSNWILYGHEPKMNQKSTVKSLTPIQQKIISDIEQMNDSELIALSAFINSLEEYKKTFNNCTIKPTEETYIKNQSNSTKSKTLSTSNTINDTEKVVNE